VQDVEGGKHEAGRDRARLSGPRRVILIILCVLILVLYSLLLGYSVRAASCTSKLDQVPDLVTRIQNLFP
jgi:hypothetical protein